MAAVEIEVGVEEVNHFQAGFFQGSESGAVGQQFGFDRAPARFGLGFVIGVARPAEDGHSLGPLDAGAVGGAGVLAAAVGLNE